MTQRLAKKTFTWLAMTLTVLVLSTSANASIVVSGSVNPSTIPANGIVTTSLEVGSSFQSTGSITVTNDTLTTKQGTNLGYMVAAQGTVALTNSTWLAESAVFVASQAYTVGTVELNDSIWTVESNMTIAKGSDSIANITLNGGSTWTVDAFTDLGDQGNATVTINDGTWTASRVTIGGGTFSGHNGTGLINIMANGIMDNQNPITLSPNGTISLDGGLLCLVGDNNFIGTLTATSNGGTIRLDAAYTGGGFGLINISDDIDFTNCDIEIYFRDGYTPYSSAEFNLFDPIDTVDLSAALANATTIITPTGWSLDYETGIMTAVPEPSTILLAIMGLFTLAAFYRKR